MQRFALLALALSPTALPAQHAAGAQLWRLAAATLPTPAALARGGAAAWWTPAQSDPASVVALELVQAPTTTGASGFVAAVRVGMGSTHRIGLAYGRMSVADLVRTTLSPDPNGAPIAYYTHTARAHWAADVAGTTLGAAVAYHQTRLDDLRANRWTLDLGVRRNVGERLVLAMATHLLSHVGADPAQNLYAAAQLRIWNGELWPGSGRSVVQARYGVAFGDSFAPDHQVGAGVEVGHAFAADLMIVREGGYGTATWRPVAGVLLRVGRYRVLFAGDAGPRGVGAAYRVGLESRLRR